MDNFSHRLFICFAAEDRYHIVQPIVYHLKNYGISTWYDRHTLLLGDDRQQKNLDEGAGKCGYAMAILSKHTINSICAMEELSIIESRYYQNQITVFPALYELPPDDIPLKLHWIKNLIYKELDRHSGTREICNHVACRITEDYVKNCIYQNIPEIISAKSPALPHSANALLRSYQLIDYANLNSRIALLYATYLTIFHTDLIQSNPEINTVEKIFKRVFYETRLNLEVDYRELWLLENSICIIVDRYIASCTESNICTMRAESDSTGSSEVRCPIFPSR